MNTLLLISSLTLALSASPNGGQAQPPARPSSKVKPHPFACTDYSQGKVFLVSAQGKVQWEYPAPIATISGCCPTAICCSTPAMA